MSLIVGSKTTRFHWLQRFRDLTQRSTAYDAKRHEHSLLIGNYHDYLVRLEPGDHESTHTIVFELKHDLTYGQLVMSRKFGFWGIARILRPRREHQSTPELAIQQFKVKGSLVDVTGHFQGQSKKYELLKELLAKKATRIEYQDRLISAALDQMATPEDLAAILENLASLADLETKFFGE